MKQTPAILLLVVMMVVGWWMWNNELESQRKIEQLQAEVEQLRPTATLMPTPDNRPLYNDDGSVNVPESCVGELEESDREYCDFYLDAAADAYFRKLEENRESAYRDYLEDEARKRDEQLEAESNYLATKEAEYYSSLETEPYPSSDCLIKGNVAFETGERIYHVPGQEYYDVTTINPAYGERWFCTEAEAIAAGWRKARQ